jgi:Rieske Fe-S protein
MKVVGADGICEREFAMRRVRWIAAMMMGFGLLAGCGVHSERESVVTTGIVNIGQATNYPAGSVNSSLMAKYGIVISNESGTVVAIHPKCGGAGCTAKWVPKEGEFECSCDGSTFDELGRPTKDTKKRALPAIPATERADGTLTVYLGKLFGM